MADRFTLQYFVMEYSLGYLAALNTFSHRTEPDAATLTKLREAVLKQGIPAVFYRELSDMKTARKISADTGARLLQFHGCENLSAEETENKETYLSLMQRNAENLKAALS